MSVLKSYTETNKYYSNGILKEENKKYVFENKVNNIVNPYNSYANSLGIPVRQEQKLINHEIKISNQNYSQPIFKQYQYGTPYSNRMVLIDGKVPAGPLVNGFLFK